MSYVKSLVTSFGVANEHGYKVDLEASRCLRQGAFIAINEAGKRVMIKTGPKLNRHEVGLMETAHRLALRFQIPRILAYGTDNTANAYCIREFIDTAEAKKIAISADGNLQMATVLTDIAIEYQKVLSAYEPTAKLTPTQAYKALARFIAALGWWQVQIEPQHRPSPKAIAEIISGLALQYHKHGASWFGYAHGDIHAEHVLYDGGDRPYLLDLNAEVKPGRGYYDQVRALDSSVVHSQDPNTLGRVLEEKMSNLVARHGTDSIPLIRARMLAIITDLQRHQNNGTNLKAIETRLEISRHFVEKDKF